MKIKPQSTLNEKRFKLLCKAHIFKAFMYKVHISALHYTESDTPPEFELKDPAARDAWDALVKEWRDKFLQPQKLECGHVTIYSHCEKCPEIHAAEFESMKALRKNVTL